MSTPEAAPRLVADVGGTNTRIAIYDPSCDGFRARADFRNRDFSGLAEVLRAWLDRLEEAPPDRACLAIAAPGCEDRVDMVNVDWSFTRSDLQARFGWRATGWLNDFEANAHGLPHLSGDDLLTLRAGRALPR
ncbi:MAG: glucokinase, partial [Anaerolineae bacterium]